MLFFLFHRGSTPACFSLSHLHPAWIPCVHSCIFSHLATLLLFNLFLFFLSIADHAPQSAVPSDTATAPEVESGLRPLYMDVQATAPLVRMEVHLLPRVFIEIIL